MSTKNQLINRIKNEVIKLMKEEMRVNKHKLNEVSEVDPKYLDKQLQIYENYLTKLANTGTELLDMFENDDSKEGRILYKKIETQLVGPIGTCLSNLETIWPLINQFLKLQKTRQLNKSKQFRF